MRKAAHLMVSSLAGSLALVTCKEPLRVSIGNHVRSLLQQVSDDHGLSLLLILLLLLPLLMTVDSFPLFPLFELLVLSLPKLTTTHQSDVCFKSFFNSRPIWKPPFWIR